MPGKFLNANEIYRLFQRELPEGVYPDSGSPSAYFSTASAQAKSITVESLYKNMGRIYDNYFPQTADEKINDWEVTVFGSAINASLPLGARRQKVINKLRSRPTLSRWEMITTVLNYVPVGTFVQIVEYQKTGPDFGWRLGVSKLGSETFLGWGTAQVVPLGGAGNCSDLFKGRWVLGKSALGTETILGGPFTYTQFTDAQNRAYGYEVRIFGVTLDSITRANLEADLKSREPARSSHVLLDGLDIVQYNLTVDVGAVDQTSLVNAAKLDNTTSTGYSGRVRAS